MREVLVFRLNRKRQPARVDRTGMTMVEMLVAMALFAVAATVVVGFLMGSRSTYEATSDQAHYQQSLRAVFSLLTRELRSAGCDPGTAGLQGITVADDLRLQCRMDLDGDGTTLGTNPDEDITYVYDPAAGELSRTSGVTTLVILRSVQLVQFSYFDADGDPLTNTPLVTDDRNAVRFVDISINGELRDGEPVTYSTRVHLRNG